MNFFDHLVRLGYSHDLHEQLKGLDMEGETNGNSIYQLTGFLIIGISLLTMLNYYYGLFNNPRFTHRRTWLLNLLVPSTAIGLFAYFQAARYLPEDKHYSELHFSITDCALFGVNEMLLCMIACLLWSLLLKWKSVANKKIPF